jgi:hypothetical protein
MFSVIITNPPYQLGKNKKFYQKFIDKSLIYSSNLLCLCPATFFNKNAQKKLKHSPEWIKTYCSEKLWGIKTTHVSAFSFGKECNSFIYEDEDNNVCLTLDWPLTFSIRDDKSIKLNTTHKHLKNKIDKITKVKPISGKGHREFVAEKDDKHIYPVYLSSDKNRRCVWSDKEMPHQNEGKLILPHIFAPGRDLYCEWSNTKGVGRYAVYFLCSEEESKNILNYLHSDTYKLVDEYTRNGRYANIKLPEWDWSKEYVFSNHS